MKYILFIILIFTSTFAKAQSFNEAIKKWAKEYTREDCNIKPSSLKECIVNDDDEEVRIILAGGFQEQHFTQIAVDDIYTQIRSLLPEKYKRYNLIVETEQHPIEDLIPNSFRPRRKHDSSRILQETYKGKPWVKNASKPFGAPNGLEGNHISLWQSHGRYYRDSEDDWYWQRPRLFCTTEDLFSQTFVVPYIIPMLENAGAVVFTPRERDWQKNEVIVDNDHPSKNGTYIEGITKKHRKTKWQYTEKNGFANYKDIYEVCDTPFCAGTARWAKAVSSSSDEVYAQWIPNIPVGGKYSVYVTYQSLENSVDDATYTIYHKGGKTNFSVNQKIGGGTWLYLGTFEFDSGEHSYGKVVLSNKTDSKGIVTADAVRFGGGMGNVVPASYNSKIAPSGLPRWAEAAKYSTFWYGFPYSIHTKPFGRNDYNNDINSRSQAVNYLSGGSICNPGREGMKVPLDLNIGFHTDAGFSTSDEFIGSLAIYKTDFNNGKTGAGMDRYVSRDLASSILTNLTTDLKQYNWQVRQLWNRDYGEAREPMSPCCILEMLSHQNFGDMRLGYDPQFKFDFSRSVYKSIVKFIATLYNRKYVIQPLPIKDFHIDLNEKKHTATLYWENQDDPTEQTAHADEYVVYTRIGNGGFDNGTLVKGKSYSLKLFPNEVYSFKVTAVNSGGESFPSEVLSAGIVPDNEGTIMIVNAFTRLEGPAEVNTYHEAGFDLEKDPGVPYGAFAGFCGTQKAWQRSRMGSEARDGLGASGSELEGKIFMGNTFDYVYIHGKAILASRHHSFTSCSEHALEEGKVFLKQYPIADIIYGTQKKFTPLTNTKIENFFESGGKLIMSAANCGGPEIGGHTKSSSISKTNTEISGCGLTFSIYRDMNPISYCVPTPSVITPNGNAVAIMTYADGTYAGIGEEKRMVRLGFPLESITEQKTINQLMGAFLKFIK